MATREQLESALRNASAAADRGDPEAAKAARQFANELKGMGASTPAVAKPIDAPAAPPARSAADETGRQAGLGVRSFLEGAGQTAGIFYDPLAAVGNAALPGDPFMSGHSLGQYAADKMGLPQPENAYERAAGGVLRGVTGGAGFVGLGRALPGAFGTALAANPGAQLTASATGSGAAELAREGGLPAWAQVGAGVVGSLTPAGVQGGLRALLRGVGEGNRKTMLDTIEQFTRSGAGSPTVGQATQGAAGRGLDALLSKIPGGAGRMETKAAQQQAGMGQRVEDLTRRLSSSATPEDAGRAIVRGITGRDGFMAQTKKTQEGLYDQLDALIPKDSRVSVGTTAGAIPNINPTIPGAPSLSPLFQNSRISGIGRALESDLAIPTTEQKALSDAMARIDALYASRNAATQTSGQLSALANQQAGRTHNYAPVPGQPRVPGRYSPFPQRAADAQTAADEAAAIARGRAAEANAIEQSLTDLRTAAEASGGKLPYEAVRKLRTLVGQEIDNAGLLSDVPRDKWRALYAALSDDMRKAAEAAGPAATAAFKRANDYSRARIARLEKISHVIDQNGGPEAVYRAALSGSRDGATTLRALLRSLPEDAQADVAAAVIRRLGRAKPGAQDDVGEVFSSETFLTNWNTVSKEARNALFDRFGPGFARDLDAIAGAAANIREGAKVFRNPPGTAAAGAQIGTTAAFVLSVINGNLPVAAGIAGGVAGANGAARVMTNPNFVRWLARQTRVPVAALPIQLAGLKAEAQATGDEELLEIARALEEQAVNQQASARSYQGQYSPNAQ